MGDDPDDIAHAIRNHNNNLLPDDATSYRKNTPSQKGRFCCGGGDNKPDPIKLKQRNSNGKYDGRRSAAYEDPTEKKCV